MRRTGKFLFAKRSISVLLAVLMLFSALPLTVIGFAESESNFTYTVEDGEATITGYVTEPTGALTIPDTLGGYPVTRIGSYAFSYCSGLTSVTIGKNVAVIDSCAFTNCVKLTSVTIEDSVTSIGSWAFDWCTALSSINIPVSVTNIGEGAFCYCYSLTSIDIPDGVKSIESETFRFCSGITTIEIGDSVTNIGDYAFEGCTGLESITVSSKNTVYHSAGNCLIETESKTLILGCKNSVIPADGSVTSIDESAFEDCTGLTSIEIPNSVKSIGWSAFFGCTGLENITVSDKNTVYHSAGNCLIETESKTLILGCKNSKIPTDGSVTNIGEDAFYYCTELTSIEIPASVTSIDDSAFGRCSNLTTLTFAEDSKLTSIGSWTFYNCTGLTSIEIGDSVTNIGDYAFYYCTGLTTIEIGDSVTNIGQDAFQGCSGLESITVSDKNTVYHSAGNCLIETESKTLIFGFKNSVILTDGSVTSIGDYAFYSCDGLTTIEIPNSVTTIGDYAFYDCDNLTSVEFGNGVTTIGEKAFAYCYDLKSIEIPDSVTSIGGNAFEDIKYITYSGTAEGSPWGADGCNPYIEDGLLYTDSTKTVLFGYTEDIPETVKIPDSVITIEDEAFLYCTRITTIEIPDSVTSIGDGAFGLCTGLTSIEIPDSVTSIGEWAFCECTGLTSIEISDSVTSIGDYAFAYCMGFESVTIPASVEYIGDGAFYDCPYLKNVAIMNPECEIDDGNFFSDIIPTCSKDVLIEAVNRMWELEENYETTEEEYDEFYEYFETLYVAPEDGKIPGLIISGYTSSTAQSYAESMDYAFKPFDETAYVTIHTPSIITENSFTAYGVAAPFSTVSVYEGENLLTTVNVKENGKWSADLSLTAPVDDTVYTIKAVASYNEDTAEDTEEIKYDVDALLPEIFTVKNSGSRTVDLLKSGYNYLSVTGEYEFYIKLNRDVASVKVASDNDGKISYLDAVYNEATGTWTATGYFNNYRYYNPGDLYIVVNGDTEIEWNYADIDFLIDPSGYVYEAVKSNRVEGATATICYLDEDENTPVWNAERYEQENPQTTDETGVYHWDVTSGTWRVRVSKAGYEDAYSDWMVVPPEYTEVAIPMVSYVAPTVTVTKTEETYILKFSKYIDLTSINTDTVMLYNGKTEVAYTITEADKEVSGTDENVYYASEFVITPNGDITAIEIDGVMSYAGVEMSSAYTVEAENIPDEPDEPEEHIHSFTNYVSDNNATCTKDGTKTAKCDNCDATDTITDTGSKKAHSFTNYVSDNNATCTKDGTKTAKCDNCTATDTVTDTGSKKAHSFTNYVSDNNATCTADGTKTAKCDNCDATDTVTDTGSKKAHSFTNYVSDNNATCTADGTKTAKCDNCTATDTVADTGSMKEHTDANADGYCDNCGENLGTAEEKCSCSCHKSGIAGFFWKIKCFFYKLFKVSDKQYCECGAKHW